jgi:hypothetical protein
LWQNWIVWDCGESNSPSVVGATVTCTGKVYHGDACIVTPNDNVSCDWIDILCSNDGYVVDGYCHGKRSKSFFLKDLCQILSPNNKKNSSENFLLKKKVLFLLVYDKKMESKALCRKLWLKW